MNEPVPPPISLDDPRLRIAVVQRVCTSYRIPLFTLLSSEPSWQVRIFSGEGLKGTKLRKAPNPIGIDVQELRGLFLGVGRYKFPFHFRLIAELKQYAPNVVICEGESNTLNNLQVFLYKRAFARNLVLIHWSLGGLPGRGRFRHFLSKVAKFLLHRPFDAFVVYSSLGRESLIRYGRDPKTITVALNVSDTSAHLSRAKRLRTNDREARRELSIPDLFTILYVGSIDRNKRIDVLLEAFSVLPKGLVSLVIVGEGAEKGRLEARIARDRQANVTFLGHLTDTLPLAYRAANVFVLPGRGGMVISEAMSYGLPVIAFQADGTERDLIAHGETGLLLATGTATELASEILRLARNPELAKRMGEHAAKRVAEECSLETSAAAFVRAVEKAYEKRSH